MSGRCRSSTTRRAQPPSQLEAGVAARGRVQLQVAAAARPGARPARRSRRCPRCRGPGAGARRPGRGAAAGVDGRAVGPSPPVASGSSTVKVLPAGRAVDGRACRPSPATRLRDSGRPRPVPSTSRRAPSRSNGMNARSSWSAGMPGPVSITSIRARMSPRRARRRPSRPRPRGLYLIAFETRLSSTCLSRCALAATTSSVVGQVAAQLGSSARRPAARISSTRLADQRSGARPARSRSAAGPPRSRSMSSTSLTRFSRW